MKGRTPGFGYTELARDGEARVGLLHTPHGDIETPVFMPVGTQGSVKSLGPEEVAATGARIVLGNTYHLWLRPGPDVVAGLGGLHGFMKWPHAVLTDSGGFQAFSLAANCRVSEDGFEFRSHLDGNRCALGPETAMEIQGKLGADIAMQLDVCPPGDAPRAVVEEACRRTTAWAERCLAAKVAHQAAFGIVQGGSDVGLRRAHLDAIAALPFDGLALGGFSVGEPIEVMHACLRELAPHLDRERPHYLMGVGTAMDLLRGIAAGIDMFDCVLPTRNARNGQALTRNGRIVIKQARYKDDPRPLDATCACLTCRTGFARGYLRHLFLAQEILVMRLLTIHNLHLYGTLMREARAAIRAGRFGAYLADALAARSEDGRPSADG